LPPTEETNVKGSAITFAFAVHLRAPAEGEPEDDEATEGVGDVEPLDAGVRLEHLEGVADLTNTIQYLSKRPTVV
jgi:hypothetical protein